MHEDYSAGRLKLVNLMLTHLLILGMVPHQLRVVITLVHFNY
jgi:hypothetical protein